MGMADLYIKETDVVKVLENTLKEKIRNILHEEVREAQYTVEKRINSLADSLVLQMMEAYDVNMIGDTIRIEVKKLKEKS